MVINDISSNNANLALHNAAVAQRPPQTRIETPPETQRPVAPTQEVRPQGGGDQVIISPQARALADRGGDNENTESAQADRRRNDDVANREARGRPSGGVAQLRAVLQALGTS